MDAGLKVVGFDNERHVYSDNHYPAQLVIQDVKTLHGSQFRDAVLIVASPPCQEYSYMAMPWRRAKQIARALRGEDEFPEGYKGSRTVEELNALFDACFRIQRQASEAAGGRIPMVVENVKGAQPWVGRARWNYGSYYLWGDVPALMPMSKPMPEVGGLNWSSDDKSKRGCFRDSALKNTGGSWFNVAHNTTSGKANNPARGVGVDGIKQPGIGGTRENGKGDSWFQNGAAAHGSKSNRRKEASAMIAKIPFELARHVGRIYAQ